jgi:hypothetical protein
LCPKQISHRTTLLANAIISTQKDRVEISEKRFNNLTDRGMQIDAIMQSRLIKFSSVGILLCRHRHTTKDLEGGVNLYQINDDQET